MLGALGAFFIRLMVSDPVGIGCLDPFSSRSSAIREQRPWLGAWLIASSGFHLDAWCL
jgi:hypothetical protein